jgi:hypothetical protein
MQMHHAFQIPGIEGRTAIRWFDGIDSVVFDGGTNTSSMFQQQVSICSRRLYFSPAPTIRGSNDCLILYHEMRCRKN